MFRNSISEGKPGCSRKGSMSVPGAMTITMLFHMGSTFKDFYLKYVCRHLRHCFPPLVSHDRMVELQARATMPLTLFPEMYRMGKYTGVTLIDSMPITVCHDRRIPPHKVSRVPIAKTFRKPATHPCPATYNRAFSTSWSGTFPVLRTNGG